MIKEDNLEFDNILLQLRSKSACLLRSWLFDDAEAMRIGSLFLLCFFPRLMLLSKNLVEKDQRNMEDTAAVNRRSEVEKEFSYFFDNERMDAIEKMQSVYGSDEDIDIGISYPRLACMIFEVRKIEKIFILFSFFRQLEGCNIFNITDYGWLLS